MKFLPDSDSLQDTTALVDLGIDSLIAVDTRSWLMRELGVDVPVMKILGGDSMSDLVDFVFENLPQDLLGRLDPGAEQLNLNASNDTAAQTNTVQDKEMSNNGGAEDEDAQADKRVDGQVDGQVGDQENVGLKETLVHLVDDPEDLLNDK